MLKLKAALGQNALLLSLCFLCIAPSVNGTGADCFEGFASLGRNDDRVEIGEGQFIMPSMRFTCDGNITEVTFVARGPVGDATLQFQAWKPLTRSNGRTSAYSLATSVDVSWSFTTNSRTTITNILPVQLPVSASHVLGVYVENTGTATLSAYELDDGRFTMYSIGGTADSLHTSDLATSTDRSVYLSVAFEISPTEIAPMMTSSPPSASEMAPSSSSSAETAPSSTSSAEMALSSSSSAEIAPSSSSSAEMAPLSSSSAEMAPSSLSSAEMAPSSTSSAETAPSSTSSAETAPSSRSSAEMAPSSSSSAEMAPSSRSGVEMAPSSSSSAETAPPSTSSAEMVPSSSTSTESYSTTSPTDGSISAGTGDSAASQAGGSVFPPGGVAGIVLAVCLLMVAMVMGMICFGVLFSRRSNKRKLDHNGYTSASFSKESGDVSLLRASSTASSVAEFLPYEEVTESSWSTGTPGFHELSAYEPIVAHQDRLGNEWFVNPHAHDGPSHLYESVTSHIESSLSLPVYCYVPTVNARLRQGIVTELSQVEQDNIYTELESVYEGVARMELAEQPFSLPPERLGPLYDYLAEKKCIEIPWSAIGREEALGAGEFAEVFKGVLETPYGPQDVAVKMLKDGSNEEQKAKFLQEGAVMAQFRHPHIVRLLGAVTINNPCALVLELLPKGDLRKYLLAQRPEPGHLPDDTLPAKLLSFCGEVADGLKYLSNKGFIHCDLAARNILLDKSLKCKIADFGMSKNVESDYYMSTGGKVPIRWTAPECLFYKKYCAGSDVWSFGMLLFEIWSLGHQPFPNLTPLQVVTKLRESKTYVQPPPPGCPRDIYQLMVYCWNRDHHQRPSAANVGDVLSTLSEPLLSVPEDEVRGLSDSTRARQLGAPLEYGVQLYTDLQQYYNTN